MSCLARRSLILRGIDRNTRELFHQTLWCIQFIYCHVTNFPPIFSSSPCRAAMTAAPSPTTSASAPRRAAPTSRAGQTSLVPQTGELRGQSCQSRVPMVTGAINPFQCHNSVFRNETGFHWLLCNWHRLGLFIRAGGNFSVSCLCHKILEIFPPDDF